MKRQKLMTTPELADEFGLAAVTIRARLKNRGVESVSRGPNGVCLYPAKAVREASRTVHPKRRSPGYHSAEGFWNSPSSSSR